MKLKQPDFNDLSGYIKHIGVSVGASEECFKMQQDIVNHLAKENYKMANVIAVMEEKLKKTLTKEEYVTFEDDLAKLVVQVMGLKAEKMQNVESEKHEPVEKKKEEVVMEL